MKRILFILAALMSFMYIACTTYSSPKKVASAFAECLLAKDFEGSAQYVYLGDIDESEVAEKRKSYAEMLNFFSDLGDFPNESLRSIEVIDEEIAEDGKKAAVKLVYTRTDGEKYEDSLNLIKDLDGEWKVVIVDMKK